MQPLQWSSTYNEQFRDRRKYVSPYAGYAEPVTRTQGYYGSSAALAEHAARTAELQARGKTFTNPNSSNNLFNNNSYSNTIPNNNSNNRYNNNSNGSQTSRISNSFNFAFKNFNADKEKDLWTHPILPLNESAGGSLSSRSPYPSSGGGGLGGRGFGSQADGAGGDNSVDPFIHSDTKFNYENNYTVTDNYNNNNNNNNIRYDSNGVAQTKYVDNFRSLEPKVKYFIPGYSGSVRGMNFVHGDTYGKSTRRCLDPNRDRSDNLLY